MRGLSRCVACLFTPLALLMFSQACLSAELKWPGRPFQIVASEKPLPDLLRELAASHGTTAVIDPKITGTIGGEFSAAPPDAMHGMELVASLYAARSAAERTSAMRAELEALGIDWLEYGRVQWNDEGMRPLSFLRSYSPPEWIDRYCLNRSWEVDERLQREPCAGVPRLWTVDGNDQAQPCVSDPRAFASIFERLAACGVGSGTTTVLPTSASGRGVAVHFLARDRALRWATREALAGSLLLAVCLNEFITKYTAPLGGPDATGDLSTLQARIACWIARGDSDKQVARSLAMSSHAVDYHLRALRRKFNVRNRVQLAQAIGGTGS